MTKSNGSSLIIFDLDKTLARCNVSFAFGVFLYHKGMLSFFSMARLVFAYCMQQMGIFSLHHLHSLAFQLIFKGQKKQQLELLASSFLASRASDFFRDEVVAKLRQAQQENSIVWIQSSSPDILVYPIAKLFNIQHVTSSIYRTDLTGRFSEIDTIVDGLEKKNCFLQFIQKEGISQERTACYSDSIVDLPLFESVAEPVVVSGDRKLMKIARKRAWQIL